jgi:hypothetical protein
MATIVAGFAVPKPMPKISTPAARTAAASAMAAASPPNCGLCPPSVITTSTLGRVPEPPPAVRTASPAARPLLMEVQPCACWALAMAASIAVVLWVRFDRIVDSSSNSTSPTRAAFAPKSIWRTSSVANSSTSACQVCMLPEWSNTSTRSMGRPLLHWGARGGSGGLAGGDADGGRGWRGPQSTQSVP